MRACACAANGESNSASSVVGLTPRGVLRIVDAAVGVMPAATGLPYTLPAVLMGADLLPRCDSGDGLKCNGDDDSNEPRAGDSLWITLILCADSLPAGIWLCEGPGALAARGRGDADGDADGDAEGDAKGDAKGDGCSSGWSVTMGIAASPAWCARKKSSFLASNWAVAVSVAWSWRALAPSVVARSTHRQCSWRAGGTASRMLGLMPTAHDRIAV